MLKIAEGNKKNLTVVVPTFNELQNIKLIVEKLEMTLSTVDFEILFVDDNSDDGTIEMIKSLEIKNPRVSLLLRVGRRGLAGACIEGILSAKSDLVAVIDCDMQHDETKLLDMFSKFNENPNLDLIVGSRHSGKGKVAGGLSEIRKIGSQLAIWSTKKFLRINVTDPMSGFFMVKKTSVMPFIKNLQPNGFKILADMIACSRSKWAIEEVGYTFKKRQSGESKMSLAVALELIGLILSHLSFGFLSIRFILFAFVGLSGIFVQLLSTFLLLYFFYIPFLQAHILSILIAMTSNFSLNNLMTYKDRSLVGRKYFRGLFSFYLICSAGALANVAVADFIFNNIGVWILASISGALLGAIWNFIFSSIFTWKTR